MTGAATPKSTPEPMRLDPDAKASPSAIGSYAKTAGNILDTLMPCVRVNPALTNCELGTVSLIRGEHPYAAGTLTVHREDWQAHIEAHVPLGEPPRPDCHATLMVVTFTNPTGRTTIVDLAANVTQGRPPIRSTEINLLAALVAGRFYKVLVQALVV